MKVLFPNGATAHLEKSVADGLVLGGICVAAPDAPGTPKQPGEPSCELIFTVGTTVQTGLPKVTARCAACRTEHHYIVDGYEHARRRNGGGVERWIIWHKGKNTVPRDILEKVHALGVPAHVLSASASMETYQATGVAGFDALHMELGRRPRDPEPGPVANAIMGITEKNT